MTAVSSKLALFHKVERIFKYLLEQRPIDPKALEAVVEIMKAFPKKGVSNA
jgi:hypothetical protein